MEFSFKMRRAIILSVKQKTSVAYIIDRALGDPSLIDFSGFDREIKEGQEDDEAKKHIADAKIIRLVQMYFACGYDPIILAGLEKGFPQLFDFEYWKKHIRCTP